MNLKQIAGIHILNADLYRAFLPVKEITPQV